MFTKIKKVAIDIKELFKDSWNTSKEFINRHPVYKKILIMVLRYVVVFCISCLNCVDIGKRIKSEEDDSDDDILGKARKSSKE